MGLRKASCAQGQYGPEFSTVMRKLGISSERTLLSTRGRSDMGWQGSQRNLRIRGIQKNHNMFFTLHLLPVIILDYTVCCLAV